MKTLTTTLSIIAFLLSTSVFSAVSSRDIEPVKKPRPTGGDPVTYCETTLSVLYIQ